jgi:hypothetical protein
MILRTLAEAIKRQDWFVVVIELLIVVFGVYIGIYLGDIQAARQHAVETDQALLALESELRSDIARLDEVIALQTMRIQEQQELVQLWSNEDSDGERITSLLKTILGDNSTFFPNKSAYRAMQTGGFLAALPDEALRLHIARLFEREYVRQDLNATFYDELSFDFAVMIMSAHWDLEDHRPLGDPANSRVVLRNGIITVRNQGQFYFNFITGQVRPDMIATLEMIDAYQEGSTR